MVDTKKCLLERLFSLWLSCSANLADTFQLHLEWQLFNLHTVGLYRTIYNDVERGPDVLRYVCIIHELWGRLLDSRSNTLDVQTSLLFYPTAVRQWKIRMAEEDVNVPYRVWSPC